MKPKFGYVYGYHITNDHISFLVCDLRFWNNFFLTHGFSSAKDERKRAIEKESDRERERER